MIVVSVIPSDYPQSNNEVWIVSDSSKLGDKALDPNPVTMNQDDTVTWTDKDFVIHTVTESQELFSSKDLRPEQTFEYTVDSADTFDYHFKVHPTMTRKIVVNI